MQVTYAFPLVPVANLLSTILALIPLPWLLQHWNTGAWTHGLWVALLCLVTGVNTILWADNVEIKAVIWCDIDVRVWHAGGLAVVTTNYVMARRLFHIIGIRSPMSERQKIHAKMFDYFFCIGVPLISIGLSWFFQGHRFNIIEGEGCFFAYFRTPVYLGLYLVWLPIFAVVAAIYGVLILHALAKRQEALQEVTRIDPEISVTRLRRVLALAFTECFFTLPCTLYVFIQDVRPGLEPWKGLSDAHWRFSAIWQVPASIVTEYENINTQWNNWVTVFTAVVFFLFFGSSSAMWCNYWENIVLFGRRFGISLPSRRVPKHSLRKQETSTPGIVFNVPTTIGTFTTHSNSMSTRPANDSEGAVHSNSRLERRQSDLEEGIQDTVEMTDDVK